MEDMTMSADTATYGGRSDIDIAALEAAAAEPAEPGDTASDGGPDAADNTETPVETAEGKGDAPAEDTAAEADQPAEPPVIVPVTVDGELHELTADEAAAQAAKGYRYDALQPVLDKLDFLAVTGDGDLMAVVDKMIEASEALQRRAYAERVGDDAELVNQLMEAERLKKQALYAEKTAARQEAAKAQEQTVNQRLAGEFTELQGMFPDLTSFEAVPETVIRDAVAHKRSLTDAYLRYRHIEDAKARAAQQAQQTAAKASAGSLAGGEATDMSPEIEAMVKGIWGRA